MYPQEFTYSKSKLGDFEWSVISIVREEMCSIEDMDRRFKTLLNNLFIDSEDTYVMHKNDLNEVIKYLLGEYAQSELYLHQLFRFLMAAKKIVSDKTKQCNMKYVIKVANIILGRKLTAIEEERIYFETLFILVLYHETREDISYKFYFDLDSLVTDYPAFSELIGVDDEEIVKLILFRNWMKVVLQVIPSHHNKGRILSIVTRICEGAEVKYITGGGQHAATERRVVIYEQEGNIMRKERPPRRKSASEDDDDFECSSLHSALYGSDSPAIKKPKSPKVSLSSASRDEMLLRINSDDFSFPSDMNQVVNRIESHYTAPTMNLTNRIESNYTAPTMNLCTNRIESNYTAPTMNLTNRIESNYTAPTMNLTNQVESDYRTAPTMNLPNYVTFDTNLVASQNESRYSAHSTINIASRMESYYNTAPTISPTNRTESTSFVNNLFNLSNSFGYSNDYNQDGIGKSISQEQIESKTSDSEIAFSVAFPLRYPLTLHNNDDINRSHQYYSTVPTVAGSQNNQISDISHSLSIPNINYIPSEQKSDKSQENIIYYPDPNSFEYLAENFDEYFDGAP